MLIFINYLSFIKLSKNPKPSRADKSLPKEKYFYLSRLKLQKSTI